MSDVEVRSEQAGPVAVERAFLIADVRGYTRFTRERGDAAAARLAGSFSAFARDAVAGRGGSVIELRGDEALAVFTSPAQAVRAAVDLVALCAEEVEANPDLPLLVGVGVDAGPAVPLEGGFRGAAINTAARLCSHAAAGQVLVTSNLVAAVGGIAGLEVQTHGALELKGFEAPVEVVEARPPQRERPVAGAPPESEPLPIELETAAPMIGREYELSWLRGNWRRARRGDGRVLFLSGPAGIGRTRLAAELSAVVAAQGGAVRYAGSGGTAQVVAEARIREAASAVAPSLLVLDEMDVLGDLLAPLIDDLAGELEQRPVLVLCIVAETDASPAVAAAVERADRDGDGHRRLAPLDAAGVRAIAELYAGRDVGDVSLESVERASGGIPGRVHELMSEWAEREAARRLTAAAEWLSAERLDRQADLRFANNVIGLKLARIYGGEAAAAEDTAFGTCPYKGLASFEGGDSRFFFGREQLIGELAARTVGVGLLAVIGASGSGKSSAIAAGLVPSLAAGLLPGSDRWQIVAMRPGDQPAAALDRSLTQAGSERLVLVIDQFEELFSPEVDEAERTACAQAIARAASDPDRRVVVIGLRADFYGGCAAYPDLARLVAANQVLVGPMRERELRRAIELPARRLGVRVESGLVDRLVAEVVDQPGGLPLLSTALVELWGERSGGWLRLDAYERAGGVRGAVARLAETSYQQLDEGGRAAARALFLRLVSTGEDGILVRRVAHRPELGMQPGAEITEVVARLTGDRLLTVTDDTIEVAHEALLREWPRLAGWLREDAQGRELREHLMQAARHWDAGGHDPGELYRGARLAATLDWAATRPDELNDAERRFLSESRAQADREADRQRRANRRLRMLLVGLAVVLVGAVAAGVVAFVQRSTARHEATVAVGRQLGAEAVSEPRIDRAMLLARESLTLDRSPQTEGTMLATLLRSPALTATFSFPITFRPLGVAVSPDGRSLAVNTNEGAIRFVNARTHRQTGVFKDGALTAVYMPRADQVLTSPAGAGNLLRVDEGTGRVLRQYAWGQLWAETPSQPIQPLVVTPNGRWIVLAWAVARPDGSDGPAYFQRWPVDPPGSGAVHPAVVPMRARGALAAAATPDGRLVVASDGAVTTWNIATLRRTARVAVPSLQGPATTAVSPDGRWVAVGQRDGSVRFIQVATGRVVDPQAAHAANVTAFAFSPDSRLAVSGADDTTAIVWDPRTGAVVERLTGHGGRVTGAAFSADGRTLYTSSLDGTVLQWDLSGRRRFGRPFSVGDIALSGQAAVAQVQPAPPAALSPDGATLAVRSGNGGVALYDARTLKRAGGFSTGTAAIVNTLSWDGRRLWVGGTGGSVSAWEPDTGRLVAQLHGLHHTIWGIAAADHGALVAAIDNWTTNHGGIEHGTLAMWRHGRLIARPIDLHSDGNAITASPDGSLLAVATDSNPLSDGRPSVLIFDAHTGRRLRAMSPATGTISLAFANDHLLATGSWEGIVTLWNPTTGAAIGHPSLVAAAPVSSIAFQPSGAVYATTGGSSGSARLWDTTTQQQLGGDFPGGAAQWGRLLFTTDGRWMFAVYGDGSAYRWPVSVGAWEQHACAVAGRNLTREEWRRYVGSRGYSSTCPQFPPGR